MVTFQILFSSETFNGKFPNEFIKFLVNFHTDGEWLDF